MDIYQLADGFRRQLLANERRAATAMAQEYGRVWKRMQGEIHSLYQELYRSGLSDNLTYRLARVDELRVQVEAEIGRFAQYANGEIVGQERQAVTDALSHSETLVRAQLPEALVGWVRLPTSALENLVGVLQDGSPLADLLAELGPEAARLVSDGLIQGMAMGLGAAAVAREIRSGLGGNLVRALRIARTETLRAYREASRAAYQANSHLVAGWIWRSGRNRRTCGACWAMDGTFHTLDEMLDGHPNCRCYMVPVVGSRIARRKNGIEAFNDLGYPDQLAVLGPAKFAAWQDGAISLTDLVGRKYDMRWGSMRYEKSLKEIGVNWRKYAGVSQGPNFNKNAARLEAIGRKLDLELGKIVGTDQRWSGKINIVTIRQAWDYYGAKLWTCDIEIREDAQLNTLVHELFHGYSVGLNLSGYRRYRGWEEGVVEKLQRIYGPKSLKAIGEQPVVGTYAYNEYIDALERLRKWTDKSEEEFYLTMIRTELEDRPDLALRWLKETKSESIAKGLLTRIKKHL